MNFYQAQDSARKSTFGLLVLFVIAIILMVVLTNIVVLFAIAWNSNPEALQTVDAFLMHIDQRVVVSVAGVVVIVVLMGSFYKIVSLSAGGRVIAGMLGGKLVLSNTNDPKEKRLINVVEEMAIAAGMPVPKVYILRDEPAINAFAAGFTMGDAVIGVTQGCLDVLNREELQGVIAHEFSHILNGDMRLNMRLRVPTKIRVIISFNTPCWP